MSPLASDQPQGQQAQGDPVNGEWDEAVSADVGHEPEAPAPVLPTQLRQLAAMLVEDEVAGLVDQNVAGADDAVKRVEIAAAGKRPASVERLVESAEPQHDLAPIGHVGADPEQARGAGIERVGRQFRAVADLVERVPEAAAAVVDGGICVDLRGMKGVTVDADARTVRAEGGLTWGEFDAATTAHGLAVTGGRVPSTGLAGLALGYHLAKQGTDFTILEAASEPAAAWRERWDSLKLFTSARYDGLPGMDFPGDSDRYPTRDDVAEYLTEYARRLDLPVELNSRVSAVRRPAWSA